MQKIFKSFLNMLRYDSTPVLDEFSQLVDFIEKQSSFVSQVTLYTYIKTRAGTQWPKLFENEQYLASLKIARWHIFMACVADLSVFTAAQFHKRGLASPDVCANMADKITTSILTKVDQEDIEKNLFEAAIKTAKKRFRSTDYSQAAEADTAFQSSAQALLDWAPVVDEFKKNDELIVRNSIHLRWISVRRDLTKGLRAEKIMAELF